MTTRNHSKSRSPVKRDACRMSQTSTIAASSQSDSHLLAPSSARADSHGARFSVLSQPPGAPLQDVNTPTLVSPFAQPSGPTYRGDPPAPAPPVSEPSPAVHLAHSDLRVHALPLSSRVWLLLSCPTRDRHLLCLPFLPSVTAITGAASVLAEALPPSLVSCATSRTSTRAPLWTRPPAPCSRRSNGSPARLPPVVASEEWALGSAIDVGRPVRPGPHGWVTSSWAPWCSCQSRGRGHGRCRSPCHTQPHRRTPPR